MEFRKLSRTDIPTMAAIEAAAYPKSLSWDGDFDEEFDGDDHFHLGVFIDDKLVGYITSYEDESEEHGDDVIYVSDLVIHPNHQRGGLAIQLIGEFVRSIFQLNLPIEGHCRVGSYTLLTKHPSAIAGFRLDESHCIQQYNGGEDHWFIRLVKTISPEREIMSNLNNKLAEYNRMKTLARTNGLATIGKFDELRQRLIDAGVYIDPPIVETPPTMPTLDDLANLILSGEPKAQDMVDLGQQQLAEIEAAQQALAPLANARKALQLLGLDMQIPDIDSAVNARMTTAQALIQTGNDQLGWLGGIKAAYNQLLEAVMKLTGLNVQVPDFLLGLRPMPHSFIFSLTGTYKGEWTVEATTLAEACELMRAIIIPRYNGWCSGGTDALHEAIMKVTSNNSVTNSQYRSTLTVREVLGITESPRPVMTRIYTFVLDSDSDEGYEGKCVVRATTLEDAKRKLLASDIVSGDRYDQAEWSSDESILFLQALVSLSEDNRVIRAHGHALKVQIQ